MAAIDEAPSLREGGPIFTFREAGAARRHHAGHARPPSLRALHP